MVVVVVGWVGLWLLRLCRSAGWVGGNVRVEVVLRVGEVAFVVVGGGS